MSFCLMAQDYSAFSIPEELKKNAHVVLREEKSAYTINAIDDIEIKESKTWTILDKEGESFGVIYIPYDKSTKVSDIKVSAYNSFGKEMKTYSKKDFSDYSNTPSFGLYVDDRVLVLKINSTGYPYTIKTSYTYNSSNTVFIRDFTPVDVFNMSVEKATRTFNNKSGIKLRTKIKNTDVASVNVNENGMLSEYTYQNIPAVVREKFSPTMDYLSPNVEFALEKFNLEGKKGDISDWQNFGKWIYQNLLTPASVITPEIKSEVASLNLSGTTEEKVKKIYQHMQDKTRYVFVAMGIGGWQPMNADDVRQKGYGDCKALTNYMRAMLDAANIPSYYSIINSDESPISFDEKFPKMDGNHVILMVPNGQKNIWLENTSQQIAFNHLSYNTTNRNVLAVDANGIKIIETPVYSAEQSTEILNAKVKLNADASINVNSNVVAKGGQYDFKMPLVGKSNVEIADYLKNWYQTFRITKYEVSNFKNDKDNAEISYDSNFAVADFSKKIGGDLFFRVMPFSEVNFNTSQTERKLPFEIPFSFQDDYNVEYEAPQDYKFTEVPQNIELKSEFGSYSISFEVKDGKLFVHRVININKGVYPKEKYASYMEFRKKTINSDNTKVLITKS